MLIKPIDFKHPHHEFVVKRVNLGGVAGNSVETLVIQSPLLDDVRADDDNAGDVLD